MSTIEIIGLVAMLLVSGGVATYLVQWVKGTRTLSSRAKWFASIAISVLVGLATSWIAGDVLGLIDKWGSLTAADVFAWIGSVYAVAVGFYEAWVKPRTA